MNNQNHSSEEQSSLLSENEEKKAYSVKHDYIFNVLVGDSALTGETLEEILEQVAEYLKVTKKEYLREFSNHPEWPSPKEIITRYNEEKEAWPPH